MAGLDGRVVVITGAGRGLGRSHALEFARQGASVVVNDLGASVDGSGAASEPAHQVVEEIRAMGGKAIANGDDVSDVEGAQRLIRSALDEFGRLDVLVNNAGILRDRMIANMTIDEWDAVIRVHLRGTFAPMSAAIAHWRALAKAGEAVDARIINTTSPSGLYGNIGQTNYGAAKAGIASLTVIAARELSRYGITVNAIAPAAATRMTEGLPGSTSAPEGAFDAMAPENISPIVVWLATDAARGVTGRIFNTRGGHLGVAEGWIEGPSVDRDARWTVAELDGVVPGLVAQARPGAGMNGRLPE